MSPFGPHATRSAKEPPDEHRDPDLRQPHPRRRPARATPARARALPLRLTRRGRLVATLVVLLGLLVGGVVTAGGLASAGTEPGQMATAERVTVRPGDTLWSIAERTAPDADPRDTVIDILRLNHLETSAVQAGTVLLLP